MAMMGDIIRRAFRECNLIGELDYPTPSQAREALGKFRGILHEVYGNDAGEELGDWPLGNFGTDQPNAPQLPNLNVLTKPVIDSRLIALNTAAITVYLPNQPQDGSRIGIIDPYSRLAAFPVTIDGNGRPIAGNPTVTPAVASEWFYRADLGQWMLITNLGAADTFPFPDDYQALFALLLAVRINPTFSADMSQTSAQQMQTLRRNFVNQYLQSKPLHAGTELSAPFMSRVPGRYGAYSPSDNAFVRGADYFWRG